MEMVFDPNMVVGMVLHLKMVIAWLMEEEEEEVEDEDHHP